MKKPSKELRSNVLDMINKPIKVDVKIVRPLGFSRNIFRIATILIGAIIIHVIAKLPRESAEQELVALIGVSILLIGSYGFIFFIEQIKKSGSDVTSSKNRKSS